MNNHTGFHEYKDSKRFNPDCPVCKQDAEITLEELAKIRDEKRMEWASIFTQIQILASIPPRLV